MKEVSIWCDGAAVPNPGRGGWAAILVSGDHVRELSGTVDNSTNNRMELEAVRQGILALNEPCEVTIHTDSELAVRWLTGVYQINVPEVRELVDDIHWWTEQGGHRVVYLKVYAHAGDKWNERADLLAKIAAGAPA